MYREWWSPAARAVVWTRTVRPGGAELRILPDGCLDIIWLGDRLVVAGPDTVAQVGTDPAGARYVGLRFPPGIGPAVLGVPAHELRDRRVPLEDLWPPARVRRLAGRVAQATDRAGAVESIAVERRCDGDRAPDPAMRAVARMLAAGSPVGAAAAAVGLSERQLHRRALAAFGYGPKTLARVLRLGRAVGLARGGVPFATVAVRAGYADQAHLAREVRSLAGVPLRSLIG